MKKISCLVVFFCMYYSGLSAQTPVRVDILKNSLIAINGTTNLISFRLTHEGEKLLGKTVNTSLTYKQNKLYINHDKISINVKNFTSDNKMALRDFLKLIKSTSYPTMDIQLNHIDASTSSVKDLNSKGDAILNITITGVTKQYHFPVESLNKKEFITIEGKKKINIRDFGLEPPVEMLGLIKVSEWIVFDFHFDCKLTFTDENSKNLTLK